MVMDGYGQFIIERDINCPRLSKTVHNRPKLSFDCPRGLGKRIPKSIPERDGESDWLGSRNEGFVLCLVLIKKSFREQIRTVLRG